MGLAEPSHGEEEEKSTPRMPPWFLEEMAGWVDGEELEEVSWVEIWEEFHWVGVSLRGLPAPEEERSEALELGIWASAERAELGK